MMGLVPSSEDTPESLPSLSPCTQRRDHVSTQWKEGTQNQRGSVSSETDHAGTLILEFQPPELRENKFLFLKPLSLRILLWQPNQSNISNNICEVLWISKNAYC